MQTQRTQRTDAVVAHCVDVDASRASLPPPSSSPSRPSPSPSPGPSLCGPSMAPSPCRYPCCHGWIRAVERHPSTDAVAPPHLHTPSHALGARLLQRSVLINIINIRTVRRVQ